MNLSAPRIPVDDTVDNAAGLLASLTASGRFVLLTAA